MFCANKTLHDSSGMLRLGGEEDVRHLASAPIKGNARHGNRIAVK